MENKVTILIKNKTIDDNVVNGILFEFKDKTLGLDMSYVNTVNSKLFIENILSDKFKLYNTKSEVLSYLSLILKENNLKSYMNKSDFERDKRELIRKKFLIANNTPITIK